MSIFGNIFNGSILSLKATHLKTSTTQSHSSADSGMKRCASCSRQRSSASCAELDKAASLQQLSPKRSQPAGQAGGEMCCSLQLVFISQFKIICKSQIAKYPPLLAMQRCRPVVPPQKKPESPLQSTLHCSSPTWSILFSEGWSAKQQQSPPSRGQI